MRHSKTPSLKDELSDCMKQNLSHKSIDDFIPP